MKDYSLSKTVQKNLVTEKIIEPIFFDAGPIIPITFTNQSTVNPLQKPLLKEEKNTITQFQDETQNKINTN